MCCAVALFKGCGCDLNAPRRGSDHSANFRFQWRGVRAPIWQVNDVQFAVLSAFATLRPKQMPHRPSPGNQARSVSYQPLPFATQVPASEVPSAASVQVIPYGIRSLKLNSFPFFNLKVLLDTRSAVDVNVPAFNPML